MRGTLGRMVCAAGLVCASLAAHAAVVDFEDLTLPGTNTQWNGSGGAGKFFSGGVEFNNTYTDYGDGFESWAGFAYSNVNAPDTAGYTNQYAVYQPGTGQGGEGNYALAYYAEKSFFGPEFKPRLTLSSPAEIRGLFLNNTAYTALSIRDGDDFTAPFGSNDWFRIHIAALDAALNPIGTEVQVYLADFRDGKTDIQSDWVWVDLSAFGSSVKHLEFRVTGSKQGDFGLSTPSYFALDDMEVVPEPQGILLLSLAGALFAGRRLRKT